MYETDIKLNLCLAGKLKFEEWAKQSEKSLNNSWGLKDDELTHQFMVTTLNALLGKLTVKPIEARLPPSANKLTQFTPASSLPNHAESQHQEPSGESKALKEEIKASMTAWLENLEILRDGPCKLATVNIYEGLLTFVYESSGLNAIEQINDFIDFNFPVEHSVLPQRKTEVFDARALNKVFDHLMAVAVACEETSVKKLVLELKGTFKTGNVTSALILYGLRVPGITLNILRVAFDAGHTEALALLCQVAHHQDDAVTNDIMTAAINDEIIIERCSSSLSISKDELLRFIKHESQARLTLLELAQLTDGSDYCFHYLANFDTNDYQDPSHIVQAYFDTVYKLTSSSPIAEFPITYDQAASLRSSGMEYWEDKHENLRSLSDSIVDADAIPEDITRYLELAHKAFLLNYWALGASFLVLFLLQGLYHPQEAIRQWGRFANLQKKIERTSLAAAVRFAANLIPTYAQEEGSTDHVKLSFLVLQYFPKLKAPQLKIVNSGDNFQLSNKIELSHEELHSLGKDAQSMYQTAKVTFSATSGLLGKKDHDWGTLFTTFFKPIETELKYRLGGIFKNPAYLREIAGLKIKADPNHISTGSILMVLKKHKDLSKELQEQIHLSKVSIHTDRKLLEDLFRANKARNSGSHENLRTAEEALEFIDLLFGERRVMSRFIASLES